MTVATRSVQLGAALSKDRITVARFDSRGRWREFVLTSAIHPPSDGSPEWPELEDAFLQITPIARDEGEPPVLRVALLPDMVFTRRIRLSAKVRRPEAAALFVRDAIRYFPAATNPQIADLRLVEHNAGMRTWLVTVADDMLLDVIHSAAVAARLRLMSITPYWAALESEVRRGYRRDSAPDRLQGFDSRHVHVVDLIRQRAVDVRTTLPQLLSMDAESRRSVFVGHPAGNEIEALDCRPQICHTGPESVQTFGDVVALCSGSRAAVSLRSRSAVAADDLNTIRSIRSRLRATLAILMVAAAVDAYGVRRERSELRNEREAYAPSVAAAQAMTMQLDSLEARAVELRGLRDAAPQWTATVMDVAAHLPLDSHLIRLDGHAPDSLVLRGHSGDAEAALTAFGQLERYETVRFTEPLHSVGGDSSYRFTLMMAGTRRRH